MSGVGAVQHSASDPGPPTARPTYEQLEEENERLRRELDIERGRVVHLQSDIAQVRKQSMDMQLQVEAEEEHIALTLLKRIDQLQKSKEALALQVEREEEYLTNTLQKKLLQLQHEKEHLEKILEHEQENVVNKMKQQVDQLQREKVLMSSKLSKLQNEKVQIENALEQEQEFMINKLTKQIEHLRSDKKHLQEELFKSPRSSGTDLSSEIQSLRRQLQENEAKRTASQQTSSHDLEELHLENLHLRQRLARELERVEALASEKTLDEFEKETSEERMFNHQLTDEFDSRRFRSHSNPTPPSHAPPARRGSIDTSIAEPKWWSERTPSISKDRDDGAPHISPHSSMHGLQLPSPQLSPIQHHHQHHHASPHGHGILLHSMSSPAGSHLSTTTAHAHDLHSPGSATVHSRQ
ncbi:hypothetical protein CAOG_03406 [Capsaspora owczarzaki ATCC 30864]|uniref:Uncharacterized protein n=1 Tax=Capsaspora owczarzaki (strain ATCC 30864) TaxID=595528 RepID=A0A0D2WN22_CAPO3|nr:hypothetical protein CAOG_03406 [Capsaspora owczarzaki ATCC 30864]KJE92430.1 hypothetical protein CAOG_003406 [Capsaspora owczarzaki ATCC 30864]|eukprot:XP_004364245.2 hypothetical protein CAOG_03406 [Capsaspora owczarzaki ATCC 30864]